MSKRKLTNDAGSLPPGPAGATSSYIFFCKEFREQNKHKNLSVTEAGALQGQEWREMSESRKAKYEKLAQADRERYNEELERYKARFGCAPPPKKVKKPVKPPRDPDLPRGASSSYMYFCKDFRARKRNQGLSVTEAGAVQGREWREMSDTKKAKYEAMAAKDRLRYNREMAIYKSTHPDPEPEAPAEPAKPAKKKKDPNAPKKPTSSYMFFNRAMSPSLRIQNPGITVPQLGSLVGSLWRDLTPDARMRFEDLAAHDRARYEAEMLMYMGSM